jgi:hypothetical protein
MTVHNHGPAEDRGLDCGEVVQADGSLRGNCLPVIPEGAEITNVGDVVPLMQMRDGEWHQIGESTIIDNKGGISMRIDRDVFEAMGFHIINDHSIGFQMTPDPNLDAAKVFAADMRNYINNKEKTDGTP